MSHTVSLLKIEAFFRPTYVLTKHDGLFFRRSAGTSFGFQALCEIPPVVLSHSIWLQCAVEGTVNDNVERLEMTKACFQPQKLRRFRVKLCLVWSEKCHADKTQ